MITLITPTRDRPEAFKLCRKWVLRQTVKPAQWIVVDDGDQPVPEELVSDKFITYIRRPPSPLSVTLKQNLLAALDRVEHDIVMIIEDDDWYSNRYCEYMLKHFSEGYDLVGQGKHIDYLLPSQRYIQHTNIYHASLCSTAFSRNLINFVRDWCIRSDNPFLDMEIWFNYRGAKKIFFGPPIMLGIKGVPGRASVSHNRILFSRWDKDYAFLRSIIGNDVEDYINLLKKNKDKIIPWRS